MDIKFLLKSREGEITREWVESPKDSDGINCQGDMPHFMRKAMVARQTTG